MNLKSVSSWPLLAILFFSNSGYSLTQAAAELVNYETHANAAAIRENTAVLMPHYEIPLEMIEIDISKMFSKKIYEHLIFKKDGKKFVRWILNPEDTKWFLEIENHFKLKGINLEKKYYFTGYQTASRSYIVEDPHGEIQFSVKSSTNKTGGLWADKKQPVGEATDSRLNSEFLTYIQKILKFENIVIMDEPAIFAIKALDQAVVIRDLADLNKSESNTIYIPGFSVLHEKMGKDIAKINGSTDPKKYWTENYIIPVGRALGELAARTGLQFDSPHSQNFLVEFDQNLKPTGRIVLRDLADLYISVDFMAVLNSNYMKYLNKFSQKENLLSRIAAGFGPLHGNQYPSWISRNDYLEWEKYFFTAFENEFSHVSGLNISTFKKQAGTTYDNYFLNSYNVLINAETEQFWRHMYLDKNPTGKYNCSYLF